MSNFSRLNRGAGVLMAISSLPSDYGIGTMGTAARRFVDLIADIKMRYWQILPTGPTGLGDSPYQPISAFAGNNYLIDLDELVQMGLLKRAEHIIGEWMLMRLIMRQCMTIVSSYLRRHLNALT